MTIRFPPDIAAQLAATRVPVVVTGAGGWLGHVALEMLDRVFGADSPARLAAFSRTARSITLESGRRIATAAFDDLAKCDLQAPLILHFAFVTRGYASAMATPDFAAANRAISTGLANFISRRGTSGLFLPSSGAVYGPNRVAATDLDRNPYGVLKLEDEAGFQALAGRQGFPLCIFRIFNLAGPFINNQGQYALASILNDIARGGPIMLRADHAVWRSYTHVRDVLSLAVATLLRGRGEGPCDTALGAPIEIGMLAARAAALTGHAGMRIARPPACGQNSDHYVGDGAGYVALAAALNVRLLPLDRQIMDTFHYLARCAPIGAVLR